MVSALAYGGFRPEELLALHVEDIVTSGFRVHRKTVDGELLPYTKTRSNRTVRHAPPQLRQDINAWLRAAGLRDGLLFPRTDHPWRKHDYDNWRVRTYQPNAKEVGLGEQARAYDLRASFVSLLV